MLLKNNIYFFFIVLYFTILLDGCAFFEKKDNENPCVILQIKHKVAPVIVDLDYINIKGSQDTAIYRGGFQHAITVLSEKGIRKSNTAVLETETVYFKFNHYNIEEREKSKITSTIENIGINNITEIMISGHTDSVGSEHYNITLSERRANEVKGFLIGIGVDKSVISAVGYGENIPIDSNLTNEGRARNRRAEIKLKGND